ncbi:hypothetical protein LDENG_00126410 [Lucifuga dentata]|nr:hypothetical protein LDENG_00126410 [Lucifuga dentata]
MSIHPSNHPLSSTYPGPGRGGSRLSRPVHTSCARPGPLTPSGGLRGIPRSTWRYNPSSVSWVFPGDSSQLDVPGRPPLGDDQEASLLDAQTTSTDSFLCRGAVALLRASHPVPEREPRHPAEEPHFCRLYPRYYHFGHYPELMTIGEDRNLD